MGTFKIQLRSTVFVLAAALLVGCQAKPKTGIGKPGAPVARERAVPVLSNTDPSAMKLHDISGALLAYYMVNKQLPERLDQLQSVAAMADGPVDAKIPGTNLEYVYTRDGIYLQDLEQWIVVYEPAPLHNGMRAVITIIQPRPDEALHTDVMPVPEAFFLLHPPEANPAKPLMPATRPASR